MKGIKIFLKKKKKKPQYDHEGCRNLAKYEKNKLNEYRGKYYRMRRSAIL